MVKHTILQSAIEQAINQPNFAASLPPLSDKTWLKILAGTQQARAENERLEFVGDALMYATLGRQLYAQLPNGTPHLYTCVRAVLHSNATFSLLAEKLDIMAVSNTVLQGLTRRTFGEGAMAPNKSKPEVKATADLFETVIGAYYLDRGFEALYAWVEEIYTPLIKVVSDAFFAYQHTPFGTYKGPGAKKRTMEPFVYHSGRLTTGPVIHERPVPKSSPKKPQRVHLSPVKPRLRMLDKLKSRMSARPSAKETILGPSNIKPKGKIMPQPSSRKAAVQKSAPLVKQAPIVIDLTLDTDSDDDEPVVRPKLVAPRIPRPMVSKLPTPAVVVAPPPPAMAHTGGTSSESEDEMMLESMLTADTLCSDMDLGSSDVEGAGPSKILSKGLDGSVDIGQSVMRVPWTAFRR